ncbi:Alpha/Beta hydrolase protein [Ochromonadaceae sp. CCMP2298]|nr:Alpha/Beta hydrolase protein [Ochromonadaceae sp. CCMP2298]
MSWVPTSSALALMSQQRLLKHYVKSNCEQRSTNKLNYVVVNTGSKWKPYERKEKVLILMHGFGLGLGFFYENIDALGKDFDRIIAVDWPGMGCSSRDVRFPTRSIVDRLWPWQSGERAKEEQLARAVAEQMVESLEQIRICEDVAEFTLAGHSLGGYLSAVYSRKHPSRVQRLVLISPVGLVPPPPQEERMDESDLDWRVRAISQLVRWDLTPQGVVRLLGPKGPDFMTNVVNRRFGSRWKDKELQLVSDYFYHITAAPGSGEYVLNSLLELVFAKPGDGGSEADRKTRRRGRTGVYAKLPYEQELGALRVPILLMFGDNDWLSYEGADKTVELWRNMGVPRPRLEIIPNAGHHLYLDNSVDFNAAIGRFVRDTPM